MKTKVAITGALSYTGRYVTKNLIQKFGASNLQIVNLENVDLPNPFPKELEIIRVPYTFDEPEKISRAIEGAQMMLGTYWVRFDDHKGGISREQVIKNAKTLIDCAREASVERYVYTSHTQATVDCHIPYIAGKAQVE
jgi:nucleoside-diphosphate-sugar epimerase